MNNPQKLPLGVILGMSIITISGFLSKTAQAWIFYIAFCLTVVIFIGIIMNKKLDIKYQWVIVKIVLFFLFIIGVIFHKFISKIAI
jgi:hypothetical protein